MKKAIRLLFSFACAVTLAQGPIAAAEPRASSGSLSLAPEHGLLLLNNGQVIEGTIAAAGDRYDVRLNDGEIRVKKSEVAAVCRDIQACYAHRHSGIEQGRVLDHLELAEWCLRNGLAQQAEEELTAARAADPSHPKIKLVESRVALAKEPAPSVDTAEDVRKAVSAEQLDTMVRGLPAGAIATFTNNIQPMLLNYCTKSGCHGSRSTHALRLERIAPNRLAGRHPTQRNLQAALAMVDHEHPEESKLLRAPLRAHGTLKAAVFTNREHQQYKQLAQWVYLVAGRGETVDRPTLEERTAPLFQNGPRGNRQNQRPGTQNASEPDETGAPSAGARPTSATPDPQTKTAERAWLEAFPEQATTRGIKPAAAIEEPGATGTPNRARRKRQDADAEYDEASDVEADSASTANDGSDAPATSAGQPARNGQLPFRVAGAEALKKPPRRAASPGFVPKDPFDPEIFNRRFQQR